MKTIRVYVMIFGCFTVVVCGCNITFLSHAEPGSGVSATEDREVGEFNAISLSGYGELKIACGKPTALQVTTDDNLLELIETNVSSNKLAIRNIQNIRPTEGPVYEISTTNLEHLGIYGSGKVSISGLEEQVLDFNISGSGKIAVEGVVDSVSIDIAGSGNADLTQLKAQNADISISGSGRVKVNASQQLTVSIAGSGRIEYIGDPKISKSIAGSGKIQKLASQRISREAQEVSDSAEEEQAGEDEESSEENEDSE